MDKKLNIMSDGSVKANHFYISSKKREYDIDVDRAIFQELNISDSIYSGQLKVRIEGRLGRHITPVVYYDHLSKLLTQDDLDKNDTKERGKQSVSYSLTKRAKREWRLNIHRLNEEHMLFRKIYERLFFYEFELTPFVISSEDELNQVLRSELGTTINKLDWYRNADAHNHVIVDELYEKYSRSDSTEFQEYHRENMEEYWEGKDGQTKAFEQVIFECALIINNTPVWIVKTEYWEINKNSKHNKYETAYRLELPGVAVKEFLKNRFVGYGNFQETDVNRALSLLIKERLLEQCMVFQDEIRYKIADQRLRHMLENLRYFHHDEFNLLMSKWEYFDEPTEQEKDRIEWLLGKEESNRILRFAEIRRHRNKDLMKISKNLEEYCNRYTAEFLAPMIVTAEYYSAYLQGKVVPNFEGASPLSIQGALFNELEIYRRTSPKGKKAARQDILDFYKYCLERLRSSEHTIESQAERLKMENADILEEYGFLHDAVSMICPLVFQPANRQLQNEIVYGDFWRGQAHRELAKMMGATYIGQAYKKKPKNPNKTIVFDYKRKKKVPHKVYMINNDNTGKKEKIVDVGRYMEEDDDPVAL